MDAQEFSLHLCSTCGNQYNSQAKLKKHTSRVHDLNPESCKQCGKRCFGKLQLASHMRCHQSFCCSICLETVPRNSASSHKRQCQGFALEIETWGFREDLHMEPRVNFFCLDFQKTVKSNR